MSRYERFQNEVVAGGSVTESADDELVGGWRGALGVLGVVGLIAVLAVFNVWWFVFVVGVLIAIFFHELGHFITAKWTGMKATQFFIGFGPRLWSFRRGETEYGVRALPLGAFVRIIGMNNMDEVPEADESRTYRQQSFPKRLLVISAGSIMHMIMAVLLLFVVYSIDGEQVERGGVDIDFVLPDGPADAAGIRGDDIVLAIGGSNVNSPDDLGDAVQRMAPGDTAVFDVVRDGEPLSIPVTVARNTDQESELEGKPFVGVSSRDVFETVDHSIAGAAVNSVTDIFPTAWESSKGVIKVLNPVNVFTHLNGTNDDLSTRPTTLVGVTGLSDDVGDAAGLMGILFLLAVLNVFIG
ncbi:MAG TPA: site-2 protease family protein, partial [Ilumatobacteraceae bacterium]|nr:site-2 protease family protein [Ilumatobacteraceae bacterium]